MKANKPDGRSSALRGTAGHAHQQNSPWCPQNPQQSADHWEQRGRFRPPRAARQVNGEIFPSEESSANEAVYHFHPTVPVLCSLRTPRVRSQRFPAGGRPRDRDTSWKGEHQHSSRLHEGFQHADGPTVVRRAAAIGRVNLQYADSIIIKKIGWIPEEGGLNRK